VSRRVIVLVAALAALMALAPAASATGKHDWWGGGKYGSTKLVVDSGTLEALTGLGVAPGVVEPAKLDGATYKFPIVNPFRSALRTGVIRHSGGISLTAGSTTVELTDFDIRLLRGQLFGRVNGSDRVALLDLDYSDISLRFRNGRLIVGPVGTTLTAGAAAALNDAFGVDALSDDTVIGDATIRYRLFGW
jgi:hypothetical protein